MGRLLTGWSTSATTNTGNEVSQPQNGTPGGFGFVDSPAASKLNHTPPQHFLPPSLQSLPAFSLPLIATPPLYSSRWFSVHGALRFEMMLNFRRLTPLAGSLTR